MATTTAAPERTIRCLIPARPDRLPWTPLHTRLVVALGAAQAIAVFFSVAPVVGYLIDGGVMVLGAAVSRHAHHPATKAIT